MYELTGKIPVIQDKYFKPLIKEKLKYCFLDKIEVIQSQYEVGDDENFGLTHLLKYLKILF